jgi:hypothetical protein
MFAMKIISMKVLSLLKRNMSIGNEVILYVQTHENQFNTSKTMKKRKILVTGSLVTTILLAGASTGFAQTLTDTLNRNKKTVASYSRTINNHPLLDDIALQWDIDTTSFKEELRVGKTPKQILEEYGVNQEQIKKLFNTSASSTRKAGMRAVLTADMMHIEAAALGMDVPTLKQDLQAKKKLGDIVAAQGLTLSQYHQNLIDQLDIFLSKGGLSTQEVNKINQLIKELQHKVSA